MASDAVSRLLTFAGVGATGVAVDLAITAAALAVIGPLVAQFVGWVVAASWNYSLNARVTWDANRSVWQWANYLAADSARLVIRVTMVWSLLHQLGTDPMLASGIAIGVAAVMGFVLFDLLVFTDSDDPGHSGEAAENTQS